MRQIGSIVLLSLLFKICLFKSYYNVLKYFQGITPISSFNLFGEPRVVCAFSRVVIVSVSQLPFSRDAYWRQVVGDLVEVALKG